MLNKLLDTVKRYSMIAPGDSVLACVSGGADSVCMLLLLNEASRSMGFTLHAAHVNHMIRGKEADRDEQYVRVLCVQMGIELHCAGINVPQIAEKQGKSLELAARDARYDYFLTLGYDKIATAHTRTDRTETLLMNLQRGSGLHGLTSIPPVRDNIIRPLIDFSRKETEEYCKNKGVAFMVDSTNLTDDCTRNKFRLNVIPEIAAINPAFEDNAIRCIRSLEKDDDYITKQADEIFHRVFNEENLSLNTKLLKDAHPALKSRVITKYLRKYLNCDPEKLHIDYIAEHISEDFGLTLPGGQTVFGDTMHIFIKNKKKIVTNPFSLTFSKDDDVSFAYGMYLYRCRCIPSKEYVRDNADVLIDYHDISEQILVRSRKPGDTIYLKKRKCTKSLKKLLCELKISEEKKASLLVFEDADGIIGVGSLPGTSGTSPDKTDTLFVISVKEI